MTSTPEDRPPPLTDEEMAWATEFAQEHPPPPPPPPPPLTDEEMRWALALTQELQQQYPQHAPQQAAQQQPAPLPPPPLVAPGGHVPHFTASSTPSSSTTTTTTTSSTPSSSSSPPARQPDPRFKKQKAFGKPSMPASGQPSSSSAPSSSASSAPSSSAFSAPSSSSSSGPPSSTRTTTWQHTAHAEAPAPDWLFDEARLDVVDGALQSDYFAWKTNNHLQAPDKFNDMLQDQALLAAYYQYAAKKFMANEVEFILKIDDYKRNPTWDKARSIVAVFLNPQSKMHANVHGDIENYIRECIKDKRAPFKDKEYRD